MGLYDRQAQGQAQTEAMALGGVERLEHPAIFLGTNAVSTILYENVHHTGLGCAGRDQDRPLRDRRRGHGVHCIHDEIEQDLLQLHRIAAPKTAPDPDRA